MRVSVLILLLISTAVCSDPVSLGAYVELDGYSEPVPIDQMINGWQQSGTGEIAQAKARMGMAAKTYVRFWNHFSLDEIGLEKRWDYHLNFSRETARFYSVLEAQALAPGEYPLELDVNAMEGRALYLKFKSALPRGITLTAKLNLIETDTFQHGSLSGIGQVMENESYSFEYDLDYQYSRNQLLKHSVDTSKAYGHSVDLDVEAHVSTDWYFNAGVKDGFYRIHWQDVASSDGCLFRQRANLTHCDQNFVQDEKTDFTQTLPSDRYVNGRYRHLGVGLREWGEEVYVPVHLYFYPYKFEYDVIHRSLDVQWKPNDYREVSIGLDNANVQQAKVWRLNVRYFWL